MDFEQHERGDKTSADEQSDEMMAFDEHQHHQRLFKRRSSSAPDESGNKSRPTELRDTGDSYPYISPLATSIGTTNTFRFRERLCLVQEQLDDINQQTNAHHEGLKGSLRKMATNAVNHCRARGRRPAASQPSASESSSAADVDVSLQRAAAAESMKSIISSVKAMDRLSMKYEMELLGAAVGERHQVIVIRFSS